jgi:hypothetical protein
MEVVRRRLPPSSVTCATDRDRLAILAPVVARARTLLSLGLDVRSGRTDPGRVAALREAVAELLAWKDQRDLRIELQEALGLSFLPRFWRTGIDDSLGAALWKPVVLSTYELVHQADTLHRLVSVARSA